MELHELKVGQKVVAVTPFGVTSGPITALAPTHNPVTGSQYFGHEEGLTIDIGIEESPLWVHKDMVAAVVEGDE